MKAASLLVAFPTYHLIPATFFARFLAMDKTPLVATIGVDGVYLPGAMQAIVNGALEGSGWDRLVIMEQDMLPPVDAFLRAASYDHDVVGGTYFRHEPPHDMLAYVADPGTSAHRAPTPETVRKWVETPDIYEVDAVGFGFTSIARRVLEEWDPAIPMFKVDQGETNLGSHDLWFCYQARQQGFSIYVDTAILCEHLTESAVHFAHNQAYAQGVQ